ncbi:uncharacterized protein LOC117290219 [Asterias rubens]|uniref:uncharacterized protein LOC117290219 n=1 Tax=Asterias rubens TaxID=7604 RepID=UPI001454EFBD|nr:uncharacterized protein LOC117290219 [Asterias rubens]
MDESELSASRRANYLTRQLGDTGGSFDVLISYDSEIQRQESAGDRTNRSQETLRELAGLSRIESPSSRQDYEEVSLPRGEILDDDISEIPVRDVDSVSTVVPDAGLVTTTGHLQTQPQFDLFSAASLPSSPDRLPSHEGPQILNSSDPLVEGDRNTARYLRILVPQQDTGSRALTPPLDIPQPQPGYSRNTSYNISDGELFESLPSTSEFLLLESPSDSPAHFSQLRLTLNSIESDGETFLSLDESVGEQQQHSLNNSFLRQPSRQHSRSKQKVTNKSKAIEDTQVVGSDLKKELQRLVVEIYSERNTEFVPIPGLISNRMDAIHSARNTTQQDLKSRTMGDGHPSFVHFQDNMSSVEDIMDAKTVSTAPDSQTTCNFDGADKAAVSGSDRPQPAGASLETLSALSSTADALALQRSVIGSSPTKPASMEEIAAAIAAAEKQYRQRLQYYKQQQQPEQQHNGNPPFNMIQATLKRSAQQLQQQNVQAAALELLQARQNVMNTLRIVMGALVVLWTPLAIRIIICSLSIDENLCGSKTSQVIGILLVAMYNMNSVINPIIYVFKYKKFRRGLQDMLCCCVGRPLRPNRIEVQIAMNEHTA